MFKNNPLLIKISIALLALLILLGVSFAWITSYTAQCYFLESHQKLNANLANFTVDHVSTFNDDGTIDTTAIQDIMHSMMVINPSVEVYLLDTEGDIITYVAPYKKIKRDRVSLEPIKSFIAKEGDIFIQGDDPRNLEASKIFSAAPIMNGEVLQGYYYIVLASEAQASVMADLQAGYALSAGARLFMYLLSNYAEN